MACGTALGMQVDGGLTHSPDLHPVQVFCSIVFGAPGLLSPQYDSRIYFPSVKCCRVYISAFYNHFV